MDDRQEAIIRDLYAAALDERPWRDAVDEAAALFGATGVFLFTPFVPESDGGLSVFHGFPEHEAKKFLGEVAAVDVWYLELLRRHGSLRTGLLWQSDALLPEAALRRTRFFNDHLAPCGIGRCLGAIVGDGRAGELPLAPLCFYRPLGSEPFSPVDERRLSALRPHVSRAMAVRQRLHAAAQGHAALAVERISTAVAVLARDRRILLANPAAEALFATPGQARLARGGRLCAGEPAQLAALERALAACAACKFDADDRLSLSVRLAGPPGSGVVARLVPPPRSMPQQGRAAAIAFIAREGHSALDLQGMMAALYRLTPSEAALVKALAEGMTKEAFADRRQVSPATVKTQLQQVFVKTGTRRQSELVRLVHSIAR